LIIDLALDPDCEFQILIQTTAGSEFREALIILSFDAKAILFEYM